jgi:uncharacterized protein (TIGR03000 family)
MRKLSLMFVLAAAGVFASAGRSAAGWWLDSGPFTTSALFPCANPQGWYTSTYYYAWMYPWYAYYNYSHGPYAGWGGFATYANCAGAGCYPGYGAAAGTGAYCGPNGCGYGSAPMGYGYRGYGPTFGVPSFDYPRDYPGPLVAPGPTAGGEAAPGTVTVKLPADAKLLFNGTAAEGTGAVRTFRTTPLVPGQAYGYDLTAEVVRDGRTIRTTERVVVRAGEESKVTLSVDTGVRTAGK